MHLIGSVHESPIERRRILDANALQIGVRHDRSRVVAHHAVAVPRRGPFGIEPAFAVGVDQPLLNFAIHRGINQIEQRKQAAERVPESGIGIHVAGQHFAVVGAVVTGPSLRVEFIELARKQRRAVETRIESPPMVQVAFPDLDAAQHIVPALFRRGADLVEAALPNLLQIAQRLFRRDERRRDARRHLLAAAGPEADDAAGMPGLLFEGFGTLSVGKGRGVFEVAVEFDDEPVAEVVRHTAAVAGRVAGHPAFFGFDLHTGAFVEGIDHHIGVVAFGEGEAEDRGTVRRRDFGNHVVFGQINAVIIGFGGLGLMTEPARAAFLVEFGRAGDGHQRELAVIVDPRRGLVRLLEAPDTGVGIGIGPAIAHLAGLGRPEIHAPRRGHRRIGISGGELMHGLAAHERIDQFDGIEISGRGRRRERPQTAEQEKHRKMFHKTIFSSSKSGMRYASGSSRAPAANNRGR